MATQAGAVVAVVDDDPAVRESLRFMLEAAGHGVEIYVSGSEFLAKAQTRRVACLVLDECMPLVTGLEVLACLRSRGAAVPVLIVTGAASPRLHRRAAELGATKVLEKPLSQDELLACVAAATAANAIRTCGG